MEWYEIVITIVVAVFGSTGFWQFVQNRKRKKSDESKLLMGIAYSKIVQQCEKCIARGYVTTDEYHELFHYLYEPYHNMGGNGTAERLMNQVSQLPTSKWDYEHQMKEEH